MNAGPRDNSLKQQQQQICCLSLYPKGIRVRREREKERVTEREKAPDQAKASSYRFLLVMHMGDPSNWPGLEMAL